MYRLLVYRSNVRLSSLPRPIFLFIFVSGLTREPNQHDTFNIYQNKTNHNHAMRNSHLSGSTRIGDDQESAVDSKLRP